MYKVLSSIPTHPSIPPKEKQKKKTHFSRALSFYDTSHINVRGFVLVTLPQEPWDSFPPCEFTNSSAFPSHSASSSPPSFSLPPCDSGALPVTVPSSLLLFPFLHVCYHWSIFYQRQTQFWANNSDISEIWCQYGLVVLFIQLKIYKVLSTTCDFSTSTSMLLCCGGFSSYLNL